MSMLEGAVRRYPPLNAAHSVTNVFATNLTSAVPNPLQAIPNQNGSSAVGEPTNGQLPTGVHTSTPATPIVKEVGSSFDPVTSHVVAISACVERQCATSTAPITSATGGPSVSTVFSTAESRKVTPAARASSAPGRTHPVPLSTPSLPSSSQATSGQSATSKVSGTEPHASITCYWCMDKGDKVPKRRQGARCNICRATFVSFLELRNHLMVPKSHLERRIKIIHHKQGTKCDNIWVKYPEGDRTPFEEDFQNNYDRTWPWLPRPGLLPAPSTPDVADAPAATTGLRTRDTVSPALNDRLTAPPELIQPQFKEQELSTVERVVVIALQEPMMEKDSSTSPSKMQAITRPPAIIQKENCPCAKQGYKH